MRILVTGAGRGLGLEFAQQLLQEGHQVVGWVRDTSRSESLKNLKADFQDSLLIQQVDLTQFNSIEKAAKELTGALDAVINNAGVLIDRTEKIGSITQEMLEQTFAVNVFAPVYVAQCLLPHLSRAEQPVLLNVTSHMGSITNNSGSGCNVYRMSKSALNMFTRSFSLEFPKIKTFCAHPGWVQTDMGGPDAPTTKQESASGLLQLIKNANQYPTGSFLTNKGKIIPW